MQKTSMDLFTLATTRSKVALYFGIPAVFLLAVCFISFPAIDIVFSEMFFARPSDTSSVAAGFSLQNNKLLSVFTVSVDLIAQVILVILILSSVFRAFRRHPRALPTAIVTISLLLGPLVIVNSVLKEHWDRARPGQTKTFGGEKDFTPAWVISDQCPRNCSFTSGHAAAGYALVSMHFIARSRLWLWIGLTMGTLIGLARISVGAHFLSDVIFSFFVVYLVSAAVSWIAVTFKKSQALQIQV